MIRQPVVAQKRVHKGWNCWYDGNCRVQMGGAGYVSMREEANNLAEAQARSRRGKLGQRSVVRLLIANALVIALALYEKWDVGILMCVYWLQSIIIGLFWFLRIVTHKHLYRRETRRLDRRPRTLTATERLGIGFFFLLHYGGFHVGYLVFVAAVFFSRGQEMVSPAAALAVTGCVFFAGELMSFVQDPDRIQSRMAELPMLMGHPYIRILPMHFTIFIGAKLHQEGFGGEWVLVVFLALKTLVDIYGQTGLERGFASPQLRAELARWPRVDKSPSGDKLILSDGQVIDLYEQPELARNLECIFELPPALREEVARGLLAEHAEPQPHEQVACRCKDVDTITGPEARRYAERHLRLVYDVGDGSKLLICPPTQTQWVLVGDRLQVKKPSNRQSQHDSPS